MTPRRKQNSAAGQKSVQRKQRPIAGLHPVVIDIALGATLLGVLSIWLTFGWAPQIDYLLAVASVFTIVFFSILLLSRSYTTGDPRWRQRRTSFKRFLKERVALQDSRVSGREALVQVALLPVMLAFAFAAIGVIWSVLH